MGKKSRSGKNYMTERSQVEKVLTFEEGAALVNSAVINLVRFYGTSVVNWSDNLATTAKPRAVLVTIFFSNNLDPYGLANLIKIINEYSNQGIITSLSYDVQRGLVVQVSFEESIKAKSVKIAVEPKAPAEVEGEKNGK